MKAILSHSGVRVTSENGNPANNAPISVRVQPGASEQFISRERAETLMNLLRLALEATDKNSGRFLS